MTAPEDLADTYNLIQVLSRQQIHRRYSLVNPAGSLIAPGFSAMGRVPNYDVSVSGPLQRLSEIAYGYRQDAGRLTRRAASAGALYPTEVVWIAEAGADWSASIYDFWGHELRQVKASKGSRLVKLLGLRPGEVGLVLVSVAWRTVQRYGFRGYRYCQLDAGNVLGNLHVLTTAAGVHLEEDWEVDDDDVAVALSLGKGELVMVCARISAADLGRLDTIPAVSLLDNRAVQRRWTGPAEQTPMLAPSIERVVRLHSATQAQSQIAGPVAAALVEASTVSESVQRVTDRVSARGFSMPGAGTNLEGLLGEIDLSLEGLPQDLRRHMAAIHLAREDLHLSDVEVVQIFGNQPLMAGATSFVVVGLRTAMLGTCDLRQYRRILLAAGVIGSRIGRVCGDYGLVSTTVGGFHDDEVAELTGRVLMPLVVHAIGGHDRRDVKNDTIAARWLSNTKSNN